MQVLVVSLAVVCAAALALPQPQVQQRAPAVGGSGNIGQCRRVSKTIYDITEKDVWTTPCKPKYRRRCEKQFRTGGTPYKQQNCRRVPKKQCFPHWEQVSAPLVVAETKRVPYIGDVCHDKEVEVCDKVWKKRGGSKVWECDNASKQKFYLTECSTGCKYNDEPLPTYDQFSWGKVNKCEVTQVWNCTWEDKTKPHREPYMACEDWEDTECTCIHKSVPVQIKKEIIIKDCSGVFGSGSIGVRSGFGATPTAHAEVVSSEEIPIDNDGVVFGGK